MTKPKMILFDYGQTLISEEKFDGLAGTRAVLKHCARNPKNVTAEAISAFAEELQRELGVYDPAIRHTKMLEVHQYPFQRYLYEYMQVEITATPLELSTIFWDHAAPGKPTEGILDFLTYINKLGIRSGVISNISFSGEALTHRIDQFFPDFPFEFIIASSEYMFRKPHPRIFQVALKKAELEAEQVWYCGDNIDLDVAGARNCGITPVWYRGALEAESASSHSGITIGHWRELPDYLNDLEA